MKIEQQQQGFQPVVITLQNKNDVLDMVNMCHSVLWLAETGRPSAQACKDSAEQLLRFLQNKVTAN